MILKGGTVLLTMPLSDTLEFAFDELSRFYFESTGKKLTTTFDKDDESVVFSLGKTQLLEKSGLEKDYSVLREDGFFITEKEEIVFIDGNTDFAVLYGVYDFLEVYLGVRFFSADTTVVPKTEKIDKDHFALIPR